MKTGSLRRQAGLNLIEILVAALILSVGLLSMAGLQVASLRSVQNATQKQQAAFIIHELLERMRSNRSAALDGQYNTAVSCASGTAPQNCSAVAACSPAQLATFDLHTLQCGSSVVATMRSGVRDQLLDGQLSVSCDSACEEGVTVSLRWREMLTGRDENNENTGVSTQEFVMSVDAII